MNVDSGGTWRVSTPDNNYTDIYVQTNYPARLSNCTVFGVRVTKAESDPQKRITPLEDLVGLNPITVDSSGVVDYGDMKDTFLFKALNHVVALSIDGTEEIELDPNDYSKRLDNGQPFTINDKNSKYNIFARADKLYIYQYEDTNYEYFYIANYQVDNNYVPSGHYKANSGENKYAYTSVYMACLDGSNRLRSLSGVNPCCYYSFNDYVTYSKNTGSNYYLCTYNVMNLYEIAFLCMFQTDYATIVLGNGRYHMSNANHAANFTTGLNDKSGPICKGTASTGLKFMHLEDLWGQTFATVEDGLLCYNSRVYCRMRPPYNTGSRSTYTQITGVKFSSTTPSGYVKTSTVGNGWGRFPSESGGSSRTYQTCEFLLSTQTSNYACYRGQNNLDTRRFISALDDANASFTTRLSYVPA